MKWIVTALVAVAFLALLLLPMPWLRDWSLVQAMADTSARWREALEYGAYLADIFLILLFGGLIFAKGFERQIEAALAGTADENARRWAETIAAVGREAGTVMASLERLAAGNLKREEWWRCLSAMLRLQWRSAHPLVLFRGTVWVLAQMPGRLYGAVALFLVLAKTGSEMALILAA